MVTSILALLTFLFSILIGYETFWYYGLMFGIGFFVATGTGAVLRRTIRGTLTHPLPMYLIAIVAISLAYWLGSHGSISLNFNSPFLIAGEWWDVIAGTIAGITLADPDEKNVTVDNA